MARNEEKAQSLLNRWTSMKQDFNDTFKNRRPYLASECDNITDAERYRRQIVKEISKKVADIQNAGLGEHVIRDLNDEINKRIREKHHWERRIVQLGGSDYTRSQPQAYDADGSVVQGSKGYRYFGAAKNLPGVRELFEKQAPPPPKRSKADMLKRIQPDYYGFREDDDPLLLEQELQAEERLRAQAMEEWDEAEKKRQAQVAALFDTPSDEVLSPPQRDQLSICVPARVGRFYVAPPLELNQLDEGDEGAFLLQYSPPYLTVRDLALSKTNATQDRVLLAQAAN